MLGTYEDRRCLDLPSRQIARSMSRHSGIFTKRNVEINETE